MIHSDPTTGATWLQLRHRVVRIPRTEADQLQAATTVYGETAAATEVLLCSAVSACGTRLAVATDAKVIKVIDASAGDAGTVLASVSCSKRAAFLLFDSASTDVLFIADKGGDVMRVTLRTDDSSSAGTVAQCEHILGHLAMLTAIDMVSGGSHGRCLATADADARIRISRLPNAYNIEAFCLGHSGPVLGLSASLLPDCLLSLSADGSLRAWRASDGEELSQVLLFGEAFADESGGRVPCHLVVSARHRLVACVATAMDACGGGGSVLALCQVGPPPECRLTNRLHGNGGDEATIRLSNKGFVAACCYDQQSDCLLLLGDDPSQPLEARSLVAMATATLPSNQQQQQHSAVAWAAADVANRSAAVDAAAVRREFFDDVLTYASLEATGFQEYLDGKDERIQRLKLKRRRAAGGGGGGGGGADEAEEAAATS